jgi:dihydroxyacetone kinase-like protein
LAGLVARLQEQAPVSDMESLTAAQVKDMFLHVAGVVVAAKEQLCDADRNIGDGDHGIGMALGFEAARKELEAHDYEDVYAVFGTVRTMIRGWAGPRVSSLAAVLRRREK